MPVSSKIINCAISTLGQYCLMRTIEELIDTDPAWPIVQDWLRTATNGAEVLPASESDRSDALVATQVTTRSPMGAIIYETGGILVDFGWIRILGSGHPRLPRTLPGWNAGRRKISAVSASCRRCNRRLFCDRRRWLG